MGEQTPLYSLPLHAACGGDASPHSLHLPGFLKVMDIRGPQPPFCTHSTQPTGSLSDTAQLGMAKVRRCLLAQAAGAQGQRGGGQEFALSVFSTCSSPLFEEFMFPSSRVPPCSQTLGTRNRSQKSQKTCFHFRWILDNQKFVLQNILGSYTKILTVLLSTCPTPNFSWKCPGHITPGSRAASQVPQ